MIAGVIGATGYAGVETVRLLAGHPGITGLALASVSYQGERIESIYPNLLGKVSADLKQPEEVIALSDVVFSALPHGVGEPYAKACLDRGISFIDLSADFRFGEDEAVFTAWYGKPYRYPALRRRSIYGLPELNRGKIQALAAAGPLIIGNPGCYPTGASLALYPALARGLAGPGTIIVDAASGVTGAGREPARAYHYPECADSAAPYKVGAHRHSPEISRNLAAMAGRPVPLIFTPHLVPMNRGILSTIYVPLSGGGASPAGADGTVLPPTPEITEGAREIRDIYAGFYRDEPFVRVLPAGSTAASGRVRQSNYCDISVHLDSGGTTLILVSAIDNMVKGTAGQAIQNMNIILGLDEKTGIDMIPALF